MSDAERRFLALALANPVLRTMVEQSTELGLEDCWLTGGAVFQTVWNGLGGRDPAAGIADYDLFYFDPADRSAAGEAAVRFRAAALFEGLAGVVEVSNQARVHLWYESHFGVPGRAFVSTRDAIDHFISPVCCFGVRAANAAGEFEVYAPHGYDDLFARRVRPNRRLDARATYAEKTARWRREWPTLVVEPWE